MELATELDYITGKAKASKNLCIAAVYQNKYDEAMFFASKALLLGEEFNDRIFMAKIISIIGVISLRQR